MRAQSGCQRVRQVRGEAEDHQREEDPDREHLGGVLEGLVHAPAGATVLRRQAVHHRGAVGRGEQPHRDAPISSSTAANAVKEKSIGSRLSSTNASAEPSIPPVANQRAPKRSERYPERRTGDQHAERQRQHVEAGAQRRVDVVDAVLGQPDALQPDDQHEHQPAARDRREERRERPERERADAKQRQAEHRVLRRAPRSRRRRSGWPRRRTAARSPAGSPSPSDSSHTDGSRT